MEKKNLVFLIPQLRHGGAERVVSRLSFLLQEHYNLKIVIFDDSNVTYDLGCEMVSLNIKPTSDKNLLKKIFNVFKRVYLYSKFKKLNNIDLTYSFGDTANLVSILSLGKDKKISSIRGFKRIITNVGFKNKYFKKPISKFICKNSDKIVCVSELMSETLAKEYDISVKKIVTIYNGYDNEDIIAKSEYSLDSKKDKLFNDNKIIITAGTFRTEKGYWHLLKAFSIVAKEDKKTKLVILGQDYQNNKQKILELAEGLKISDKIIYEGYQKNPFKYFSKSFMYVLSSTSEGFPNSLVEAMNCNIPIVASDCNSGPREILNPFISKPSTGENIELGEYGILVKNMSSQENYDPNVIEQCDKHLAEAILKLLKNKELTSYYTANAKKRSLDFNSITWVNKHVNMIDSILN